MDTLNNKTITIPGKIIVEEIIISSNNGFTVDLRPNIISMELVESIQNVFVSGNLLISEALNFIRFIPIIGTEKVTIKFYTPGFPPITTELLVSKISRIITDGTKAITYKIDLISPQYIISSLKKISESYSNKSYSEMAQSIFNRHLQISSKSIITKTTQGKKNIVLPYMSPSDAILFLASRSTDSENNCNFVFYETFSNEFYFKPLFDNNVPSTWEYRTFLPNMSNISILQEYTRIRELEIYDRSDSIKNITQGVYSSELVSTDVTYKQIKNKTLSYSAAFEKTKHLNPHGILPTLQPFTNRLTTKAHYKVYPKASYAYDNIRDNDNYEDQLLERNFQLLSSDSFKIAINVFGDTRRRVGEVVNMFINAPQSADLITEKYDPYLSGRYLIASIRHIIQLDVHYMNLLLIKDSNMIPQPDIKETS